MTETNKITTVNKEERLPKKFRDLTPRQKKELFEYLKVARQHAAASQSYYEAALSILKG
jgi:hypothetical protein